MLAYIRGLLKRRASISGGSANGSDTVWIRDDSPFWTGVTVWVAGAGLVAAALIIGLWIRDDRGRKDEVASNEAELPTMRVQGALLGADCQTYVGKSLPVDVQVATNGSVSSALAVARSRDMQSCIEAHVRTWTFAPQERPTTLHVLVAID